MDVFVGVDLCLRVCLCVYVFAFVCCDCLFVGVGACEFVGLAMWVIV